MAGSRAHTHCPSITACHLQGPGGHQARLPALSMSPEKSFNPGPKIQKSRPSEHLSFPTPAPQSLSARPLLCLQAEACSKSWRTFCLFS